MTNEKKRVVITIQRGIPEVIECPDGIDVEIRDYDIDGYEDDQLETDGNGDLFLPRE